MSHMTSLETLLSDALKEMHDLQQYIWWLEGTIKARRVVETPGAQIKDKPTEAKVVKPGPNRTKAKTDVKPGPDRTEAKTDVKPGPNPTEAKTDAKPSPERTEAKTHVKPDPKPTDPRSTTSPTPKDCKVRQEARKVSDSKSGHLSSQRLKFFRELFKDLIQHEGGLTSEQAEEIKGNHTLELANDILNGEEDQFTEDDWSFIQKKPFLMELMELSKEKSVSSKEEPKSRSKRRSDLTLSERFEKGDPTLTYEQICSLRRSGRINGAREEQYYFDLEESKKGSLTEQQVESLEQYYSDLLKRFEKKVLILTERQVEMLDKHYSGLLKRFEEKDRTLSKDQIQSAEQYCLYLLKRFQQKDLTLTEEQIQSLEKIGRVNQAQVEKYYASTKKFAAVS